MLVKFFKNKNGGSAVGIDYLLNKRVEQGTANLLKGNATVTRKILRSLTKKQKLCIGCLSFEEKDIDLDIKQKIIDEFERLLFGEYKERFSVLWVQHVDKGRLELNFAIPKIDIESSMAFNPYYDKVDRPLIDTWQNYVNLKFGFTDPKDPAKAHMLQGSRKEIGVIKDYIELEKILTDKFINQEFACREDILKALKDTDIEVTRVGKDYISVKLLGTKKAKRFKGICLVRNLETLRVWSNSEVKLKQEQRNLEIEQISKQISTLQDEVLYLQTILNQKNQEILELSNSNKTSQNEIKSLQDSKESLTNKYKNAINGLKYRLAECRSEADTFKILSAILTIAAILVSIYAWRLYLHKNDLVQVNRQMKMYIKQNIDGEQ